MRDTLFLLKPDFEDPKYPGRKFYCPYCVRIEGVLAYYPWLAEKIDVRRVPFEKPRREVVALVGEENQALPLLVLGDDAPDELATGRHGQVRFVADTEKIQMALAKLYGVAEPHP